MKKLTEEQWLSLAEHASDPVELKPGVANCDEYWVYDREYGFFQVGMGLHRVVMAHLYAFRQGYDGYFQYMLDEKIKQVKDLADAWIELPGNCFHSSQGIMPTVWSTSNLNYQERKILGPDFREIGD